MILKTLQQRMRKPMPLLIGMGVVAGSVAIALAPHPRPACAQGSTYTECVAELIRLGVSPNVAAQQCQASQPGGLDACVERTMMVSARATSGPTDDGEWRYPLYGPQDGSTMRQAGCRLRSSFELSGWRCPSETMRFQVMSAAEATAICRGDSPTPRPTTPVTLLQRRGNIDWNQSQVSYEFQGSANQTVRIRVIGENGFDPVLRLEDRSGRLLAENDDEGSGNFNSLVVYTLPSNGQYRAIVRGFGNQSGQFTIVVEAQ